jgi:glycosyltransferase involved in cell wall biosynthesis
MRELEAGPNAFSPAYGARLPQAAEEPTGAASHTESSPLSGGRPIRLALFAASPIHYQVPLYQRLASDPHIDFTAIFASNGGVRPCEAGYGRPIQWDVDLLKGYRARFLRKAGTNPIGDGPFFTLRDLDIVKELRLGDYDVLWLFGYNHLTHQLAALTHSIKGRPILFREVQTLLHSRPVWKLALKKLALPLLFRNFFCMYPGTQNKRWLSHYGVREKRMYFTPYSVDNARFQGEAGRLRPAKAQLQRGFGLDPAGGPVILTVARLIPKKQPLFLLEAFRRLRTRRRCSLLVVGSGPLESALREKIRQDSIPDVALAGFLNQSQISRAYACADIFVLPSKIHETWGAVVNEAMNFGLPLVLSDKVGGAIDLVRHGENGYIVGSEALDDLSHSLMRLVDSEDLRREFGALSLQIVGDFNYELASQGVLRAVADAVGWQRWHAAAGESHGQVKVESN